jgi:C_GCAxxG_C_C family probable redox protein
MTHGEKAEALFYEGYNCAQAVFCAYADEFGLERGVAAKLVSPLGGGMGRLREVCGTVSGGLMVIGQLYGYGTPDKGEAKARLYAIEQEFAGQGYGSFKKAVGEATVEMCRPIREETNRLLKDKAYLESVYRSGAEKAGYIANKTLRKVYKKVGFVQP